LKGVAVSSSASRSSSTRTAPMFCGSLDPAGWIPLTGPADLALYFLLNQG
jgi:hypothetical protein